MDIDKALATQLANIETRTGKTVAELVALVRGSGLAKHGEQVAMLKQALGMGHGDANTIAHVAKAADAPAPVADADPLDAIYTGPKAGLRPIHEALVARIDAFGSYETAPKKGYVSLRRKKQFAMVGPATKDLIEIGINARDLAPGARLKTMPAGGMCPYTLRIAGPGDIDAELTGWLRAAYDAAG